MRFSTPCIDRAMTCSYAQIMISALTKCLTCSVQTPRAFGSLVCSVRLCLPVLPGHIMLYGFHTSCTHPPEQSAVRPVPSQPLVAFTRHHSHKFPKRMTHLATAAAAGEQPVMQDAVQQQEHQPMNQHDRCTQEQMLQMVQEYDCWVFDCDGKHATRHLLACTS